MYKMAIAALAAIMTACAPIPVTGNEIATIVATEQVFDRPTTTPESTENAAQTATASQTAVFTPTATPSETPYPPVTPFPDIVEVSPEHRDMLAALCWVEARAFTGDTEVDACLSVIATVLTRTRYHIFSDGTIDGTLGWHCTDESETCHFPAYVLFPHSCEGIVLELCPANSPTEVEHFRRVVDSAFDEGARGSCSGYLYYGSRPSDVPECVIEQGNFYIHFKTLME